MRTIKFRGKEIKIGKWKYGDLMQLNDGSIRIGVQSKTWTDDGYHNNDYEYEFNVDEKTIGQFTGLRDKNGKEIYEGDVIRGKYDATHLIQYNEEEGSCFAYRLPISEFSFKGHLNQDWINEYSKVVIGNIHDNPELLNNND